MEAESRKTDAEARRMELQLMLQALRGPATQPQMDWLIYFKGV